MWLPRRYIPVMSVMFLLEFVAPFFFYGPTLVAVFKQHVTKTLNFWYAYLMVPFLLVLKQGGVVIDMVSG